MPRSLPLLFALSCFCSLPAQLPPGARTFAPGENMIPWPAELGTGAVRDLVGLFWHTNDNLAAIGLRGAAAGTAVAPGISSVVRTLDLGMIAADAVALPLAAGPENTQHDALLFSGLTGVDLGVAWSGQTGEPVVTLVTQSGWSRSTLLNARKDATGVDVAGKSFAGTTLLRTRFEQGSFVQVPGVEIGATIRDLCFVDYNEDEVADVAVLTDTELRIVDLTGTTLFSLALAAPGGAIEPVPQLTQRHSLALLRRKVAPAGWELVHISQAAVEAPQAVTLLVADNVLGGMGSGDFDGDGIYDLAIQDSGNAVRLVLNLGAAPHFAGADTVPPVTIGNVGSVQGPASVCDYDHDGCADLLVPLAAAGSNWLVLSRGLRGRIDPAAALFPNIFDDFAHELDEGGALYVGLRPEDLSGFTRLVITGYTGLDSMSDGEVATLAFEVDLTPDGVAGLNGYVRVLLPGAEIDFPKLLFVQVQLFDDAGVQRPSFLTGGTIDHEEVQVPTSDYLIDHTLPGAVPQDITRYNPRQLIGLHVRQVSLPIR